MGGRATRPGRAIREVHPHPAAAGGGPTLPTGSVVLFRYGQRIVGEAVVWKGKETFAEKLKDRTLTGEEAEYGASITFAPSSIRLYAPPVSVEWLQLQLQNKDVVKFPPAYHELEWDVYAKVLQQVVSKGMFMG